MILEALSYSRSAVDEGQWWRLVTASLAHLSTAHAIGNLAALALLGVALRPLVTPLRIVIVVLIGALATGVGIHLLTDLDWYAGLSGALWALAGQGAIAVEARSRLGGRGLVALLAFVVWLDQYRTLGWTGEPLAAQAHLYGFVTGLIVALASRRGDAALAGRPGAGRPRGTRLGRTGLPLAPGDLPLPSDGPGPTRLRGGLPGGAAQNWRSGTVSTRPSNSSVIRI